MEFFEKKFRDWLTVHYDSEFIGRFDDQFEYFKKHDEMYWNVRDDHDDIPFTIISLIDLIIGRSVCYLPHNRTKDSKWIYMDPGMKLEFKHGDDQDLRSQPWTHMLDVITDEKWLKYFDNLLETSNITLFLADGQEVDFGDFREKKPELKYQELPDNAGYQQIDTQ